MAASIEPHYEFNAGSLCLDFTNTVWERTGYELSCHQSQHELIHSFGDLVRWGRSAGILNELEAGALFSAANKHPKQAFSALREALTFREEVFQTLLVIARDGPQARVPLDHLNKALMRLPPQALAQNGTAFLLREIPPFPSMNFALVAAGRDVAQLLCNEDLTRLKVCGAPDCGWLFLDTSKNRTRRWCDMSDCGNRDKVNKFLARQKLKRAGVTHRSA